MKWEECLGTLHNLLADTTAGSEIHVLTNTAYEAKTLASMTPRSVLVRAMDSMNDIDRIAHFMPRCLVGTTTNMCWLFQRAALNSKPSRDAFARATCVLLNYDRDSAKTPCHLVEGDDQHKRIVSTLTIAEFVIMYRHVINVVVD